MSAPTPRGLLAAVRQLAGPDPDSDADLVRRFVAGRDESAFAALVRRHGPAVLAVCRRQLGAGPDADDAFQVAFMVLARDADRIADPHAVAGWLYRVAHLTALKLRGRRRSADPLPDAEPPDDAATDPGETAAAAEFRRLLDEELAALPDKLRAVVVLCCVEERSNAEAARLLGCPTGTVDSRLNSARKRLRAKLLRRGVAPTVAAAGGLDALAPAGGPPPLDLFDQTTRAAVGYAARGFDHPLVSTANGVTPLMGTVNAKLLVAGLMATAALAGAGFGLLPAPADDGKPADVAKPSKPAEPPKPVPPEAVRPKPLAAAGDAGPKTEAELRKALAAPAEDVPVREGGIPFKELLNLVHERYNITARLDMAAFKRLSDEHPDAVTYYETPILLPVTRGMSVVDLLTDATAQLPGRCAVRLRGNQVLIGPAFSPPIAPGESQGALGMGELAITRSQLLEQIVGPPVSIAVDDLPLTDALKELREQTGANIILDARCKEKARNPVAGSFSDVRLLTVLQLLGDMCELRPVAMNNVYYVTTPENAAKLQKEINRDLFGEPAPPAPQPPSVPGAPGIGGAGGGLGDLP